MLLSDSVSSPLFFTDFVDFFTTILFPPLRRICCSPLIEAGVSSTLISLRKITIPRTDQGSGKDTAAKAKIRTFLLRLVGLKASAVIQIQQIQLQPPKGHTPGFSYKQQNHRGSSAHDHRCNHGSHTKTPAAKCSQCHVKLNVSRL